MKTIHKFQLDPEVVENVVDMPTGWRPRHVDEQDGQVTLWVEYDDENDIEQVKLQIFGTGDELPLVADYLGTALVGAYVWHVYRVVEI